ncbi:MAG: GNAT family N-acetyltransferase [Chitinophagaceae bacterium]|nr:GNAT family N-acetyltransferase [Chitinophagaceae bacterium]
METTMTLIERATENDYQAILDIGRISVKQAHLGSCPEEDLDEYMKGHYNAEAIQRELSNPENIYHILYYNGKPAGFSKLVLNAAHENVEAKNSAKLDRIYILPEYFDKKLGAELLRFSVAFVRQQAQKGVWLVTWIGNTRAINFYSKAGFKIIGSYNFQVTATTSNLNHQMYLELG